MSIKEVFFPQVMITGERSIRFQFSDQLNKKTFQQIQQFCDMVNGESRTLFEETVPGYLTVTVYLKREIKNKEPIIRTLLAKWEQNQGEITKASRRLKIPVCYGEPIGLDMEKVMNHTGLSETEIITLHSRTVYTVYMIGFLPGFPYLGGLSDKLATPRLATPRLKVPKGAVGIGGSQTGIYPLECPGGWNLIGKTPIEIYSPEREEPFFIRTGDELTFFSISLMEFRKLEEQLAKHPGAIKEFIQKTD